MADSLTANINAAIQWTFRDALDLTTIVDNSNLSPSVAFADGTSAGQADKIWSDTRTVAGSGNDDLDLTALTNSIFGSTVTINFAKVKAILIVNTNIVAGDFLWVGGGGSNEWTNMFGAAGDKAKLGPGSATTAPGIFLNCSPTDGWVVDGTHKTLRITNGSSNSNTYKIVIVGTSV